MHTPEDERDTPKVASSIPKLPQAPSPSADKGLTPSIESSNADGGDLPDSVNIDIFTLTPVAALKMLCEGLLVLVRITGDVPPTPPITAPSTPNAGFIQADKENVPLHDKENCRRSGVVVGTNHDDAVPAKAKTPIGSPEAHPTEAIHPDGARTEALNIQHGAITRKFYSKKPPPIGLEDYLTRLHTYCPMSTAVYLATSLYIHRLAVVERILPVTARSVHRLVLAGLRVASKALDDLSHAHTRFAKVGGVTDRELGRLEVSFCFVIDFELKVDEEMLLSHAKTIREGKNLSLLPTAFQPKLPPLREKLSLVVGQTKSAALIYPEAPAAV